MRTIRTRFAVVLVAGLCATGAAPADAASARYRACVAQAQPSGTTVTAPAEAVCFDSLAAAIGHATGGNVMFDVTTRRDVILGVLPAALAIVAAGYPDGGGTVIGIDHDFDYIDADYIWSVSNTQGCLQGDTWEAGSMPSGWNDEVDAATAYQGCTEWTHYEHANFNPDGGATQVCTCETMGAMEDETSSEKWAKGETAPDAQFVNEVACPAIAAAPTSAPGVLEITNEGDIYVLGELFWDCPPYV